MKRLIVCALLCGFAMPAMAQFSPVQVTVQRLSKKKSEGETGTVSGNMITIHAGSYSAQLALRITLHNPTVKPITGLTVRWGIVKSQTTFDSYRKGGDAAYGAEETLDLKPQETRVIETPAVEASGKEFNSGESGGEKIRGHGVQLVLNGRTVFEEFTPPTCKKAFDTLRPVEGAGEAAASPKQAGEKPAKGKHKES